MIKLFDRGDVTRCGIRADRVLDNGILYIDTRGHFVSKTFAAKGSQTKRPTTMLLDTVNVSVSDYCMTSFVFQKIVPSTHKFAFFFNQSEPALHLNDIRVGLGKRAHLPGLIKGPGR